MLAIEVPQNSHILPECPNFSASSYITNFVNSFISEESGIREAEFKVQHYAYSSFGSIFGIYDGNGNNISSNPVIEPFYTYTGREYDKETGLYYYRARYYDSLTGRFLQIDPDPGAIQDPTSFNSKYSYVSNRPISLTDPTGKTSIGFPPDVHGKYCGNNKNVTGGDFRAADGRTPEVKPKDRLDESCYNHDMAYQEGYHWFSLNAERTREQMNRDYEIAYYSGAKSLEKLRHGDVVGFMHYHIISAVMVPVAMYSTIRHLIGVKFKAIGIKL